MCSPQARAYHGRILDTPPPLPALVRRRQQCVYRIGFRGFLFSAMSERRGAVTGHVFLYGLLFCTVFHRTGKLAPSMILHGMINLVLTLLGQLAIGV